ncbi:MULTISPECIES: GAF domain-containing sensor histidine kinase [unclassified Devosia]|uniref:GAF domain-containing sensor histidine kinase n=1 Tax=unclassified Devosia TaxID=196773 RepID=UPI0025FEF949|nr:GAF domain-containing sensor histidine kinase [Devosia sp.]MCR6636957.1 GAF domain-containing sensor histidine kinase [Devosia sp.]
MPHDFQNDINAVQRIAAVPTILDVACRATGMGFAAVARVTEDRWIACQVLDNIHFGLPPGGELKVETTLCHEIRQHRQVVAIDNVAEDATYQNHHTPQLYGLQSYISVPITLPDGRFFGTLCAIDPNPHKVNNPQIIGTFTLFAELIAHHLDAEDRILVAETKVVDGLAMSDLREQFIAVLGHDLRNPLAGLEGGRRMLSTMHDDPKSVRILRLMGESVARMSGLIDNLMDFARGRLGGGIGLQRTADQRLEPLLAQIVNEIKAGHPEREIEMRFDLSQGVNVDQARIGQMFSNLMGNAITHGAEDQPIIVEAVIADGHLLLAVANGGQPIPASAMERLFQPFHRGGAETSLQGLGLGLYIASQIAEAHGGTIEMTSDAAETRFTFRMPLVP